MAKRRKHLPFVQWPPSHLRRWEKAFQRREMFCATRSGADLAPATQVALKWAYARFLGFMARSMPSRLSQPPQKLVNSKTIDAYVAHLRRSCSDQSIATSLHHLRLALVLLRPSAKWDWLLQITKRIAGRAVPRPPRHHLVTSEALYQVGVDLMTTAVKSATRDAGAQDTARAYRDGLMIAFLAAIPLRRRAFACLRLDKHCLKSGDGWVLDIPGAETKNRRPLTFKISRGLSGWIDLYLKRFRPVLAQGARETWLWVSYRGQGMTGGSIYDIVGRRTHHALGYSIALHRFRHAAATFWSVEDPTNVRGVKDLLGHSSFTPTEKHYVIAQSRMSGRRLSRALMARAL